MLTRFYAYSPTVCREGLFTTRMVKGIKILTGMEGLKLYTYKSEILTVGMKWLSDKASKQDIEKLDELLNERASEGWELVTYDYMATSTQLRGAFVITFRKGHNEKGQQTA